MLQLRGSARVQLRTGCSAHEVYDAQVGRGNCHCPHKAITDRVPDLSDLSDLEHLTAPQQKRKIEARKQRTANRSTRTSTGVCGGMATEGTIFLRFGHTRTTAPQIRRRCADDGEGSMFDMQNGLYSTRSGGRERESMKAAGERPESQQIVMVTCFSQTRGAAYCFIRS